MKQMRNVKQVKCEREIVLVVGGGGHGSSYAKQRQVDSAGKLTLKAAALLVSRGGV